MVGLHVTSPAFHMTGFVNVLSAGVHADVALAGIAAFLLTIGAIALEGARFGRLGIGGVFGWLSKDYLLGIG